MSQKKTAILLFSFSEQEEKNRKSFLKNNNLHQKLVARIKCIISSTKIDYYCSTENIQKGSSFGERFSNAIASIYAKGYDNVITIGNDIPNLKASHILEAQKALENNQFVLGPAYDGGFYLMGLQKEYFNKTTFKNFSWNTSKVALEIKSYIRLFTSQIILLEYLRDIDRISDLKLLLKTHSLSLSTIGRIIQQILQETKKRQYFYIENRHSTLCITNFYNKGSPLFSL